MTLLHRNGSALKKQHVALLLALLAGLSYAYSVTVDMNTPVQAEVAGIPMAAAALNPAGRELEMFLKFDTIDGDSLDTKHRGEVEVDSFAWDQNRALTSGKPTMNGFRITMPVGTASPKMFLYSAGGVKLPRVVLSVRKKGSNEDFLTWTFTQGQILEYKTVGNTHGDGVMDQITLGFAKLEMQYRPVLPNGSFGSPINAGWDQRSNKSS